jgi:hypothetical protein
MRARSSNLSFQARRDDEFFFRSKNKGRGELNLVAKDMNPAIRRKYDRKVQERRVGATARESDQSGLRDTASTWDQPSNDGNGNRFDSSPTTSAAPPPPDPNALIWSVQAGAIDMIKYLRMRAIRVGLAANGDLPLAGFLKQLNLKPDFDLVLDEPSMRSGAPAVESIQVLSSVLVLAADTIRSLGASLGAAALLEIAQRLLHLPLQMARTA